MPFLLLVVVLPLIEIALFIVIGGVLTLWPTLALVVAGSFAGYRLIRSAGVRTMAEVQGAVRAGIDPGRPVAAGLARLLAGILLFIPGFLTGALGILLLIPPVRQAFVRALGPRGGPDGFRREPTGPVIIEGEFTDVTGHKPVGKPTDGSPWRGSDRDSR